MSDKKRRDITLGEMQDECKRNDANACGGCECRDACWSNNFNLTDKPKDWDLSDPPRFNEAQMALLRALYGLDFVSIKNLGSGAFKTTSKDGKTGMFMEQLGIGENETLDLAELLGKDGAE